MARNKSKVPLNCTAAGTDNTIVAQLKKLTHFRHGENLDFELLKDVKSFPSFDPYTEDQQTNTLLHKLDE